MSAADRRQPADVAVLVPSFDGVAEVWPIFIEAFWRAWPDCPYPLYIGTNALDAGDPRAQTIKVGPDQGYASTILAMLDRIDTPWVFLCVEDFPFAGKVNGQAFADLIAAAGKYNAALINTCVMPQEMATLFEQPGPTEDLAEILAGDPYCCALGAGLWRTDALRQCLKPGESAWDIERVASWRVRESGLRFFRMGPRLRRNPPFPVVNLIESGLWTRRGYAFLRELGIPVDLTRRRLEPRRTRLWLQTYQLVRFIAAWGFVKFGGARARRVLANTVGNQRMTVQN